MKCSVCAQDIPEDRYSEHLENEHGVTDDPTAVLIQHLTGLHSTTEDDGDDVLPDDEPSDADAFEEFLAAHPVRSPAAGEEEADEEAPAEEAPAEETAAAAEPAAEEPAAEPVVAEADDADEAASEDDNAEPEAGATPPAEEGADEAEGEALTDEDEAEFERMLAVYPEVDLRKGKPEPAESEKESGKSEKASGKEAAAAGAAAGAAGAAAAGVVADRDEKTFAVWDEARAATSEEAADGDVLVVAPSPAAEKARRRRQLAMLGLGAAIILVAIAVIYLLTRNTSSKNTAATVPVTTPATTVPQTFLPGPPGGATTTVVTQPPVATTTPATTAAPATTAVPATTTPPNVDPKSQISFPQMQGVCNNGQLSVGGHTTNNNAQAYTYSFTITFANSAGGVLGSANGTVSGVPAHSTVPFTASGSCTDVNGAASRNVQITSITPA